MLEMGRNSMFNIQLRILLGGTSKADELAADSEEMCQWSGLRGCYLYLFQGQLQLGNLMISRCSNDHSVTFIYYSLNFITFAGTLDLNTFQR